MAELNQELQQRLDELERDLEEGDITQKGYQKRRTQLFSQYGLPQALFDGPRDASVIRSPVQDGAPYGSPPPPGDHRAASFAALNANSASVRPLSTAGSGAGSAGGSGPFSPTPASPVDPRIHSPTYPANLLAPGGPIAEQRASLSPQDSLFLSLPSQRATGNESRLSVVPPGGVGEPPRSTADPSRSATMVSTDYAFNPDQQQLPPPQQQPQQSQQAQQQAYGQDYGPPGGGRNPSMQIVTNPYESRTGTMVDSQAYFSDFAGQQSYDQGTMLGEQQYGGVQRYSSGGAAAPAGDPFSPSTMGQRYSIGDAFSPTAATAPPMLTTNDLPPPDALEYQMPLEPRDVPFAIYDPHDTNTPMSKFDNIAAVLRHRGRTTSKMPAYWVLDSRGKEIASITWEKLASRAEKVAQVIRDKSSLYRGDRVALVYRDSEIIEFAIALLGCFVAGVVAVPINELNDYQKLNLILTSTQAHLALTTENNLKTFQRDITTHKLNWPKGVEWWKTNEFGSFHPKKKDDVPPLSVPDLAYIEFSRAPTGDLRGVVLSHRTIMHQLACLSAIVSTVPSNRPADTFNSSLRDKNGRLIGGGASSEILLSYLDPRQGIGMILAVLFAVYGGHTVVWLEHKTTDVPGLYAHLISKYKATLMAADYTGLKRAVYNYQQDPMTTRNYKKGMEPNFQAVKLCLIDTLTVDAEFHEVLADRWLRPLRNPRAREVVAPMLCLPEHGGMVISIRDWLGGEERMGCPLKLDLGDGSESDDDGGGGGGGGGSGGGAGGGGGGGGDSKKDSAEAGALSSEATAPPETGFGTLLGGGTTGKTEQHAKNELSEVLLDSEALKTNEVVVLAVGEEARKRQNEAGTVRVGAFGYPIPDATLAVVDPENCLLSSPHTIGEIWVDSPSLSGGFWALPKHTEQIFHARPYKFDPGDPTPTAIEPEFLRTGLLGTIIEGKIFVLGLYEDRIRQRVEWVEHDSELVEYRYFFVQHIVFTILRTIPKIFDCSAFDVFVNEEHLPIVLLETTAASTAPATAGGPPRQLDTALLDSLAERCMDVLMQVHRLRVYCVMITAPNALPRVLKNGRREIGNMLCRREFDLGNLACVHVKFGVEHAVLNLPFGVDPMGGIWSRVASDSRAHILAGADSQYSGIDRREVVIDDKTSTPLNNFSSITDLIQWRVARQPEELSYCTIDGRGKEGKGITWKKFDTRVAAVAIYLKNKVRLRAGDHAVLMYTHSDDFVFAVHACLNLGVIVLPMAPMDQNRLSEDVPAFLHLVADFRVKAVLVNQDVDHLLKMKTVSQHIKQSAQVLKLAVPSVYNTSRPPKQNSGLRDLGLTMDPNWVQPTYPALIWTYWTPDQRRVAVQLSHDTILGMCKVQKETCQMTSSRPVLGCVRSTTGLGFIHTCLMGIYIGTPTYLLSPVDFAQSPVSLFLILSRYKIKDTYATPQMLDHAMAVMPGKGFTLHELKNMMITAESRPRVDVFQKVRLHFAATGLDRTAINTVYSHVLNPMVASRSYMCIEPIELWLDTKALRRGLVLPVDPDTNPRALLVQDSGMVPVSTQIAIVNPESRLLCLDGEFGEIWVDSEACVKSFYGSRDAFDAERFNGRTVDGDPSIRYVRTGDLGFLHSVSRPIGPSGAQVDMQVLFVLGNIGETFEINGLSHFPMDIESSVQRCHRSIVPGGCAVFQAGGLVVVLVEVARKAYLASIVPVIVNAILNEHQIVVDIVAFVNRGDFPRSRLGEKQRGKILAGWVSRKMRTMAQFAIRDMAALDAGGGGGEPSSSAGGAMDMNRASLSSMRSSAGNGGMSGSLRNNNNTDSPGLGPPQILEQRELEQQHERVDAGNGFQGDGAYFGDHNNGGNGARTPQPGDMGAVELPGDLGATGADDDDDYEGEEDVRTPTQKHLGLLGVRSPPPPLGTDDDTDRPPTVGPKPPRKDSVGGRAGGFGNGPQQQQQGVPPQMYLPGVDGRPSMDDEWQLSGGGYGGGNNNGSNNNNNNSLGAPGQSEDDWTREALMGMNLADDFNRAH
ncbi:AMP-binding domain protein [Niveomyces insectorum RCEF 264]|uniref:AMP-binding domain protein n=1 Tax=Niveomyces insectorum RCEF 264 TaxID=1081102 RepID=A0A167RIL8_9HYPO|nr:AMP-binding domain protein [Niveomyces insectorum RCEF 264]